MLQNKKLCYINFETGVPMNNQNPKVGKKGAIKEVAKILNELRKKPLSKKVFEIVQENYDRNKTNKKVAKPVNDLEA